jgi:succinoglycan biosynthesis protein ExoV
MHRYVWHGPTSNFGDALNDLIWPLLLPGRFAEDVDAPNSDAARTDAPDRVAPQAGPPDADSRTSLFLGIGSVLDARHAPDRRKVVAGAGFGGYAAPASLDGTWEIYWVRGPRTAQPLGLPASFGLGDPASLLPLVYQVAPSEAACGPIGPIGFMPHFESLARGAWEAAATAAGVLLIDPRAPPRAIVAQIAGCRVLLSEALHGAIVADALRVPWVALAPIVPVHRAKWLDWADSLDLTIRFHAMPASTPRERLEALFAPNRHSLRTCLGYACALAQRIDRRAAHLDHAVAALRQAAGAAPQLSRGRDLARAQGRMLDRLHTFRADQDGSAARGGRAGARWLSS